MVEAAVIIRPSPANWDSLPKLMDQYEVGTVVPGVVQMVKKFGVFLRVPGLAKLVLAPTRLLQDYLTLRAESYKLPPKQVFRKMWGVGRRAPD